MASIQTLADNLKSKFGDNIASVETYVGEVTVELSKENLLSVCRALRDDEGFKFDQLIDVCAVDYSEYGEGDWEKPRYAVVYHLLSVETNQRLRLKVFLEDGPMPLIASVNDIWNSANWYEREAFDLFGIVFEGHPDLRRLLIDYGFIGHPFRRDFPLEGNVEMRYDPEKQRVVYEPVSIEMRELVPKVIRHDNRYQSLEK